MSSSFFLTKEIMLKYGAPMDAVEILNDRYPNGVFAMEILDSEVFDIDIDFVHWMYINLPLTKYDKELYLNYAEIKNSSSFIGCYNITNCDMIADSIFCNDSSYIFNSSYVNDSFVVYNSEDIVSGFQIFHSSVVADSEYIMSANRITNSKWIFSSKKISDSNNIGHSENIGNSYFIIKSKKIENSLLSRDLNNCKNKILCYDLEDNDIPMILNEEVSENLFNQVFTVLLEKIKKQHIHLNIPFPKIEVDDNDITTKIFAIDILDYPVLEISEYTLMKDLFDKTMVSNIIKRALPKLDPMRLYDLSLSNKVFS